MESRSTSEVTKLLRQASAGERAALDRLTTRLYATLRRQAHHQLRGERAGHTLSTTALVHEAYLELVDVQHASWRERAHFLAAASCVMRHVLVDYARRRNSKKRGGTGC